MCSTRLNFHFNMLKKSFVVFLLLTLAACGGGGGDGGSNANVTEGKETNPYLVSDKNSIFYYDNNSSGVKFSDAIVADNSLLDVLVYPTGGKEYYFTDKEQIAIKGFYSPHIPISNVGNFSADFMFNDKLILWQKGNVSGTTKKINTSGSAYISPKYGRRTISAEGTSTFYGIKTVTVPYGTFEAIHVSYDISVSLTIDGFNLRLPRSGELWLVEGFGIVKRSEGYFTSVLTNYEGNDSDGDSFFDIFDRFPNDADEHLDTDNDGSGNNEDEDDDGDGIEDINDGFPLIPAAQGDSDGDGYLDRYDFYPLEPRYFESLTSSITSFNSISVLGDSKVISNTFEISGTNIEWDLSCSVAWLQVSQNSGSGDQNVTLTVDVNGLTLGLNEAELVLTNKFDGSKTIITVTVNLILPTLSLSVDSIVLDGSFSWKNLTESLWLSLNTGSNTYGVTYQKNFPNDGVITVDGVSNAGVLPSYIEVKVGDISTITGGEHSGEIIFTVNVLGEEVNATLDVNILASKHMLLVPDSGVALSKFVTVEKLSHSVDILDNYGLTSTNWSATTDAPWLTITTKGTTADTLTITADAMGLEADSLHRATITVSSSDASIENSQTINVGLWVSSADPKSNRLNNVKYSNIASDPVRPYVYFNAGSSNIDVYHVYDQTLVTTITEVGTVLGKMEASADGQFLYVADTSNDSVIIIDLDDTSNRNHWQSSDSLSVGFTLSKTNGRELLISEHGNLYDAQTGKLYIRDAHGDYRTGYNYIDASLFGNRFCAVNTSVSGNTVTCYDLSYSTHKDQVMQTVINGSSRYRHTGGFGRDIALNNEGTIAYTASNSPYTFIPINIDTMTTGVHLPAEAYPSAVEVGPDNALHGASDAKFESDKGVWVYESTGVLRTFEYIPDHYFHKKNRALAISGDGFISITLTSTPSVDFVSGF